jgi:hypothetical protein
MKLSLNELCLIHAALRGHPVDFTKCGSLALQRSGHTSPVWVRVEDDGVKAWAEIDWHSQALALLDVLDEHRITEDGAEAVAISYVNGKAGWVVKRRLQRRESADWLLRNEAGWLALEVSGTVEGDPFARLNEKKRQVARCSLPAKLLAIVVVFARPTILVGGP